VEERLPGPGGMHAAMEMRAWVWGDGRARAANNWAGSLTAERGDVARTSATEFPSCHRLAVERASSPWWSERSGCLAQAPGHSHSHVPQPRLPGIAAAATGLLSTSSAACTLTLRRAPASTPHAPPAATPLHARPPCASRPSLSSACCC
jgi:hypothetical protein